MKKALLFGLALILALAFGCSKPVHSALNTEVPTDAARPTADGLTAEGPGAVFPTDNGKKALLGAYSLPFSPYLTPYDFIEAVKSGDGFRRFREKADRHLSGIDSLEDAQAILDRINGIPFPVSADLFGSEMHFFNSDGRDHYSIYYSLHPGDYNGLDYGYVGFSDWPYAEEGSAKSFEVQAKASDNHSIDVSGHAHITRLYISDTVFVDWLYFFAEIDGHYVSITTRGFSREAAAETILSFDFCTFSEAVDNDLIKTS